ncbi:MAG: hypothetical protein LBH07_08660 [Treponema sp.]|jgi:hypothetical protein|nr:hypothetical protein [Treponema sp.]
MKKLLMTVFIITIAAGLYAQNTFFPSKAGMVLTYANKDAKGKATSYTVITVMNVQGSGRNMTITYMGETLDKNRKRSNPPNEIEYQVVVKDGVVILDMKSMFPGMKNDPTIQVEITGTAMEIPANLQPGQTLKDADVTMSVDMIITKLTTVMKMTEGKDLAVEDVTVQGGAFKCHKISQKVTTTIMRKTTVTTTLSWYALGIGTIKTESYDEKNKLIGSMELIELKGN